MAQTLLPKRPILEDFNHFKVLTAKCEYCGTITKPDKNHNCKNCGAKIPKIQSVKI